MVKKKVVKAKSPAKKKAAEETREGTALSRKTAVRKSAKPPVTQTAKLKQPGREKNAAAAEPASLPVPAEQKKPFEAWVLWGFVADLRPGGGRKFFSAER